MNLHVEYLEEKGFIKATIEGEISKQEIVLAQTRVRQVMLNTKCYLLLDGFSNATFKIPLHELYGLPKDSEPLKEVMKQDIYEIREAILVSEIDDKMRFIENVFYNRGIPIRVFLDEDNAVNWLLQDTKP